MIDAFPIIPFDDDEYELNEHRSMLFIALMLNNKSLSWRSKKHNDGYSFDSCFICGMRTPDGDIAYYLDMKYWSLTNTIHTIAFAPICQVNNPEVVISRLHSYVLLNQF